MSSDNTIAGSTGFPLGFLPAPAGQNLDATHAAMDSNPLTNLGVSWVSTDANTGALLAGGSTLVGLREGSDPRADFGDAATPVSHPSSGVAISTSRSTRRAAPTPTSRRSRSQPRRR